MLNIYTDGGCRNNPGLGAWAFIVVADDKILHQQSGTSSYTTNNCMELTAILRSLEYLEHLSHPSHPEYLSPITIFSDSQYSINAITLWYPKWLAQGIADTKKNINLIKAIHALIQPSIRFVWVKGHSTNPFNNLADRLVNEAMDQATVPCASPQGK